MYKALGFRPNILKNCVLISFHLNYSTNSTPSTRKLGHQPPLPCPSSFLIRTSHLIPPSFAKTPFSETATEQHQTNTRRKPLKKCPIWSFAVILGQYRSFEVSGLHLPRVVVVLRQWRSFICECGKFRLISVSCGQVFVYQHFAYYFGCDAFK